MTTSNACEKKTYDFSCTSQKDCVSVTFQELVSALFESAEEKKHNIYAFSDAYSCALGDLIVSSGIFDRDKSIHITATRNEETINMSFYFADGANWASTEDAQTGDRINVSYSIIF